MPIADRNLNAGTQLVARYKGTAYRAKVVQTEEGMRYRLENGREFKSPSSAGSAVMGGKSVNRWVFWRLTQAADGASGEAAKPKPPNKTEAKRPRKGSSAKPPSELASNSA
jgi:hypothetical protein